MQLNARNLGANNTYSWNPPTGLDRSTIVNPVFKYDKTTEYTITIATDAGCSVTDTLLVRVSAAIPPACEPNLYVPRAWSPNGDGHNDYLFPFVTCIRELKYFRVFNRWGQLVFETNAIGQGWNGIFNGKPQVIDTYTWTAEAIGVDGSTIKRSGNSVLIK